jgi:hypothetical protein
LKEADMNKLKISAVTLLFILVFYRVGWPQTSTTTTASITTTTINLNTGFEYAVKFICGAPNSSLILGNEYATAINIFNPGLLTGFTYKTVTSSATTPSACIEAIPASSVISLGCSSFQANSEGFVIIDSRNPLIVRSVISAGSTSTPPTVLSVTEHPGYNASHRSDEVLCSIP